MNRRLLDRSAAQWVLFVIVLSGFIALLFSGVFDSSKVLFSNDGPLGGLMMNCLQPPSSFVGVWQDLNTLGNYSGGYPLGLSGMLYWGLGPLAFAKFFVLIVLVCLGAAAWFCFRGLGLHPVACWLGALAAALNSGYFSAAAWGVGSHAICIGGNFIAIGLISWKGRGWRLLQLALAGVGVGIGIIEGADIGAIFSLCVAAYVCYLAFFEEGAISTRLLRGVFSVALVAAIAAFISAHSIVGLISSQIQGVAGASQDNRSKQERWDWATQWSLPKKEALGFIVPGLFGYRMDTEGGGNYWGAVGRDPAWDRYFAGGKQGTPPQGFMRFTGGGVYAGILVAMVAVWAALQATRKKNSVFDLDTRRRVWFWSALLLISLLLSFGRFAPFYQLLYALPYFSTIRNPAKFTHVFNWALLFLFAHGVHGLWTYYLKPGATPAGWDFKGWWTKVRGFDRLWTIGSIVAFGAAALGWLIYGSSRKEMISYLQEVQFDENMASLIASFSSRQLGIWLLLFACAIVVLTLLISGAFSGPKARWGVALMGLFIVADLGRANQPWIVIWDYKQKYATNPIIEKLRTDPNLQRTAILPSWVAQFIKSSGDPQLLDQLYRIEWAQHHFYYYNIPSLDIVQMPRMPEDLLTFETALQPKQISDVSTLVPRRWELSGTRWLIGSAEAVGFLNQQVDPGKGRFKIAERFTIQPKTGIREPRKLEELTAVPITNGPYALIEFMGALPRAGLYSQWQVHSNDQAVLQAMASPAFNPQTTVLLSSPPAAQKAESTNQAPGTVRIKSYAPKHIVLQTECAADAVLLMTDRFDPNWLATVDGKTTPVLKPNFLMRGAFIPAGKHEVEFKFSPPSRALYVSAAAWGVALLLALAVIIQNRVRPS